MLFPDRSCFCPGPEGRARRADLSLKPCCLSSLSNRLGMSQGVIPHPLPLPGRPGHHPQPGRVLLAGATRPPPCQPSRPGLSPDPPSALLINLFISQFISFLRDTSKPQGDPTGPPAPSAASAAASAV